LTGLIFTRDSSHYCSAY